MSEFDEILDPKRLPGLLKMTTHDIVAVLALQKLMEIPGSLDETMRQSPRLCEMSYRIAGDFLTARRRSLERAGSKRADGP